MTPWWLLILTNDTQFAERLTNPDHKVVKTYLAKCAGPLTDDAAGGGAAGARCGEIFAHRDADIGGT